MLQFAAAAETRRTVQRCSGAAGRPPRTQPRHTPKHFHGCHAASVNVSNAQHPSRRCRRPPPLRAGSRTCKRKQRGRRAKMEDCLMWKRRRAMTAEWRGDAATRTARWAGRRGSGGRGVLCAGRETRSGRVQLLVYKYTENERLMIMTKTMH